MNVVFLSLLGTAFFNFNLQVFNYPNHTGRVTDKVPLKKRLYFQASVETSSHAPNLDLFLVNCHSSKNRDPTSTDGKVTLIEEGQVVSGGGQRKIILLNLRYSALQSEQLTDQCLKDMEIPQATGGWENSEKFIKGEIFSVSSILVPKNPWRNEDDKLPTT